MDRSKNPFAPGAGLQPPQLAGRDALIEDATIDFDRIKQRRPVKSLMLLGLRGVGKTVLLNRLLEIANKKGIKTAKIEAPEGGVLPALLAPELRRILYSLDLKLSAGNTMRTAVMALRNFASVFKVKIGEIEFGLEPSPGSADSGDLEQDLPDLLLAIAEAAAERKTAIGLFIDEVQYLSPKELAALVVACHEIAQKNLPLIFVGAGLPQIAALAGNAKSYAERLFNYPEIDKLTADAATLAITIPIKDEGAAINSDAVSAILRVTDRYPYFLQEWGFHIWNTAEKSPISKKDVDASTPGVIDHLDRNFFRVRFDRLTGLQQKYLRAMAELGAGPHKTGDISAMLGVEASTVAPVRAQLIAKGMVWSQRHGETGFSVPLFDGFMKRQMPTLQKHTPKARGNGSKAN